MLHCLLTKYKSLFHKLKQLFLYGLNGIVNTVVTYSLFVFLSNIIDYRVSIAIVYPIGILISYSLNKKTTFRKAKGNLFIFFAIMILMFSINLAITWILVEFVMISKELAQALAIGVVFIVGFLLNKKFSFTKI